MLKKADDVKQIWIATHSLFLVPELSFKNIIYVKNSQIQRRSSSVYKDLFVDLFGESQNKTQLFFSSLEEWQYCEFLSECFLSPTVLDTIKTEDEQVQLFIEYLKQFKPLRVLDYGGGSGRLGSSLLLAEPNYRKKVKYDIYDIQPSYNGNQFKVYNNVEKIKGPYHCIVMMNLLHEVDPAEWQKTFNTVQELLVDNGYLVFVEVKTLSIGEKPNNTGYLMLGKNELETLFRAKNKVTELSLKSNQKSICAVIPKCFLSNISPFSIKRTIMHLEQKTWAEIQSIRSLDEVDSATSRKYAFLTQQYINAKICLEDSNLWLKKAEEIPQRSKQPGNHSKIHIPKDQEKRVILLEKSLRLINLLSEKCSSLETLQTIQFLNKLNIDPNKLETAKARETLSTCWNNIQSMEARHEDSTLVSILLLYLALLGHKKSLEKINQENYYNLLPQKLRALLSILE